MATAPSSAVNPSTVRTRLLGRGGLNSDSTRTDLISPSVGPLACPTRQTFRMALSPTELSGSTLVGECLAVNGASTSSIIGSVESGTHRGVAVQHIKRPPSLLSSSSGCAPSWANHHGQQRQQRQTAGLDLSRPSTLWPTRHSGTVILRQEYHARLPRHHRSKPLTPTPDGVMPKPAHPILALSTIREHQGMAIGLASSAPPSLLA